MRKSVAIFTFFVMVVFSCSAAWGATSDIAAGMGEKIFRGALNILTGWVELPVQIMKGCKSDKYENKVVGAGAGFLKGIGYTLGRTAWGVVEVAGFWAANPTDNYGIGVPLEAKFAWEEGEPYDYCDPSFKEATLDPMGRKLIRGLQNGLFGVIELPGQIAKGIKNNANDYGIIKGIWFSFSREFYGVADVATVLFPAAEDNPGYPFDEEYPWDALLDVMEE